MTNKNLGKALIVDDEVTNRVILRSLLHKQGYQTIEATNGQEAVELFRKEQPEIIFMDVVMPEMDGYEATRLIKSESGNRFVPILFLTVRTDEESLSHCIDAGGDDFLIKPYDSFILETKIQSMQRIAALNRKIQDMYSIINREQEIAESVFTNAIQGTNIKNPNIRCEIRPAATFSGDMILSAYSPTGDLLFLTGDFTGHGLSAALGAMPVSEVFQAMTAKGFSAENILTSINRKLKAILPVGMFFGVQLIVISYETEQLRAFNAGMPDILIIDGASNEIKHQLKSRGLPLGIIDDIDPNEIFELARIAPNDKILMFSDGVPEARNGLDEEFGDDRLLQAINSASKDKIYDNIFAQLDQFCGDKTQVDDITLVEITCANGLRPKAKLDQPSIKPKKSHANQGEWEMSIKFAGTRLRETNPVPIVVNQIIEMETLESMRQSLFTVITELYVNALDHGVLDLNSDLKSNPAGFAHYFQEREKRLAVLQSGFVIFNISAVQVAGIRQLVLRVEDSGNGFDHKHYQATSENITQLSGRGILLIKGLCESLTYEGVGNIAKATIQWNTE